MLADLFCYNSLDGRRICCIRVISASVYDADGMEWIGCCLVGAKNAMAVTDLCV